MQTINKNDLIPIFKNSILSSQFDCEITVPTKYIPKNIVKYKLKIFNDMN